MIFNYGPLGQWHNYTGLQWCSKFQAVADSWAPDTLWWYQLTCYTSNSSSKAFSWETKKAQHWNWLAYLWLLPWPCESKGEQSTARGECRPYILWQTIEIIGFLQQISEAAASWKYEMSQIGQRGKTSTTTSAHSWDLELFIMTDCW